MNIAVALVARGVSFLVPLLSVPLTVAYLGDARFGVWTALTSVVAWFSILDLGLAHATRNRLSMAFASGDVRAAREVVATTMWSLAAVSLTGAILGAFALRVVDVGSLLSTQGVASSEEMQHATLLVAGALLVRLPLSVATTVYSARQEHYRASAWDSVAALAGLGATVVATRTRGGLVSLAIAAVLVPLLVQIVNAVQLFGVRERALLPRYGRVRWQTAKELLAVGSQFLLVQVAAIVVYQTDSVIVAKVLGPVAVTEYGLASRLCWMAVGLQGLVLGPLWPAYSEAVARRDWEWVSRQLRRTTLLTAVGGLLFAVVLGVWGQSLIVHWSGTGAPPSLRLRVLLGCWTLLLLWQSSFVTFLNAIGAVRIQSRLALVLAPVNFALCVVGARWLGLTGVALANVLTMLVGSVQAPLEAAFRLRALRASHLGHEAATHWSGP